MIVCAPFVSVGETSRESLLGGIHGSSAINVGSSVQTI